ncbi:hypothetical protein AAUPMC_07392, partial [Pasteurella multocida subsp. multocida str. Anand1_cattle]
EMLLDTDHILQKMLIGGDGEKLRGNDRMFLLLWQYTRSQYNADFI